jgi:hypothetical protein
MSQRTLIEPTSEAWEASVLPLNYVRSLFLIVLAELFVGPVVRLIHGIKREQHIGIRQAQASWLERLPVTQEVAAKATL